MAEQFIDTCCNLSHPDLQSREHHIIRRALAAGVVQLIAPGSSVEDSRQTLALADKHQMVYASVGIHPHTAKEWNKDSYGQLKSLLRHKKPVAIGECGLDYCRNYSPPERQRTVFERQIQLAAESGLPLLMHQRDAHNDFIKLLKPWRAKLKRAVVHCFTGQRRELFDYLDLDLHIGITGWFCDERRGKHLRALVKDIPANRLLLETDAPYLRPRHIKRPLPGEADNEPALLPHIAEDIAGCLRVPLAQLARQTTSTARRFYGLDAPPES